MFFLKELPTRPILEAYAAEFEEMDIDAVEAALIMMRRASLLLRRLEAYFAAHGLSQLRFLTLIVIDREPEPRMLTVSEVADRLDVSRPVTTRTLRALTDAGLVTWRDNTADGRSHRVILTAKGKRTLREVLPGYYLEINAFMRTSDEVT